MEAQNETGRGGDLCRRHPSVCDGTFAGASLGLQNQALTGFVPTQLGLLTNVTEVHLESNKLSGTLPTQLASPTKGLANGTSGTNGTVVATTDDAAPSTKIQPPPRATSGSRGPEPPNPPRCWRSETASASGAETR